MSSIDWIVLIVTISFIVFYGILNWLDTKDRKGDAELFLGGKKAGEIADHPMNKIVYQR